MYRIVKIATLIFFSLAVVISLAACGGSQSGGSAEGAQAPPNSSAPPEGQLPSGAPGGLSGSPVSGSVQNTQQALELPVQTSSIVGTGTVTVATYANLYFGSAGQIASINVKQGDQVTKGTILAKLDTSSLELTLAQDQNTVDQAQAAIDQAQQSLLQDQLSLVQAQQNLNAQEDVQAIQEEIDNVNYKIAAAQAMVKEGTRSGDSTEVKYWREMITEYETEIVRYQEQMETLLSDPVNAGSTLITDATSATEIQQYTLAVQIAQQQITTDQSNLAAAQSNLILAQKTLELDQLQLAQATILAPLDGLIAQVYYQTGDILSAPSQSQDPVIYMIDPGTMQLDIYVNELDMPQVKLNQKAGVSINAFPDAEIDGVVSAISPVSTTLDGVIYYCVTVNFSVPSGIDVRTGMNGSAALISQ